MKEDTSSNLRQVIPWTQFTGKMILPLFLIIVFCSMTYNSHAQETRLNLKLENTTLLDAIKQISTTTGMEFFYNAGQVKAYDKRISKEFTNAPLTQVLEFLLDKTPFTYKLEDKTIVIVQRPVQANTPKIKLIELKGVVFDKDTREPLPGVTHDRRKSAGYCNQRQRRIYFPYRFGELQHHIFFYRLRKISKKIRW